MLAGKQPLQLQGRAQTRTLHRLTVSQVPNRGLCSCRGTPQTLTRLTARVVCNGASDDTSLPTSSSASVRWPWSWEDDSGMQQAAPSSLQERWTIATALNWQRRRAETLLFSLAAAFSGSTLLGSGFNLEGPGSVLQALGVLALIVTIHECGHFLAARGQGIHVTRFAIGFGPALWTYQGGEVEYSLRLFPLGGYVAFPDDDPNSKFPADDPNLLKNRSIAERTLVISAGIIANFIFAYLVLLAQVSTVGKAESAFLQGVKIPDVVAGSAAARAGFRNGDIVLRVGDYEVPAGPTQVSGTVATIRANPGREVVFVVQRDGQPVEVPCTPDVTADGVGKIGVQITSNTFIKHIYPRSTLEVFSMTQSEFSRLSGTVLTGLQKIFTNFSAASTQLSGPVAIVASGAEIARTDSAGLFQFCAIININLAFVNLLPLPALDGGYLLLLLVEALRGGKKLPQGVEQGVMASGLLLLMTAGIGLVIKDTLNLL